MENVILENPFNKDINKRSKGCLSQDQTTKVMSKFQSLNECKVLCNRRWSGYILSRFLASRLSLPLSTSLQLPHWSQPWIKTLLVISGTMA